MRRQLRRVEKLRLLSKLERSGILSTLEASGIDLDFIEKNKLLSKAEDFGAVRLLSDRCSFVWWQCMQQLPVNLDSKRVARLK